MEKRSYEVLDGFWAAVRRWRRKTLHDKVLIVITACVVVIMLISACALDSDNWQVSMGLIIGCCVWLGLFLLANGEMEEWR